MYAPTLNPKWWKQKKTTSSSVFCINNSKVEAVETLIEVKKLKKYYPVLGGVLRRKVAEVKAIDGVDFRILKGQCFGLVGESGCGKTTLGKTIIRLLDPTAGNIYFEVPDDAREKLDRLENSGQQDSPALKEIRKKYDLATYRGARLNLVRRKMQIVYQDPTTSLNPRMLVKDIVSEPLIVQGLAKGQDARKRVLEILYKVKLTERHLYRYPHEFSGGQRQRIAVARALVTNPEFVVLDEPTSSVDVSVRAQLLNLFQDLQKDLGLTYIFVSHDLSVVECIAHRVAVMYLGKIVELAQTEELYKNPVHPYSQALFASIPIPDPTVKKRETVLSGEVPSPVNPPSGCRFHPRCPIARSRISIDGYAREACAKAEPELMDIGGGHLVACYLAHH
jgi:oligopeptide/dipeptide ABC transporter ATP-binding protein